MKFFRLNFFWNLQTAPEELVEGEEKIQAKKAESIRRNEFCSSLNLFLINNSTKIIHSVA
jgi:hypothetical protein